MSVFNMLSETSSLAPPFTPPKILDLQAGFAEVVFGILGGAVALFAPYWLYHTHTCLTALCPGLPR